MIRKEKSRLICAAFAAGAPKNATGAVFFGTEGVMQQFQSAKSGTWWYIDNSYFDTHRGLYFRATKNALQVNPRGRESDGQRFAQLRVPIKPWRTDDELGSEILVCPQSDDFMKSTLGRGPAYDWTRDVLARLEQQQALAGTKHPVVVRSWNRDKKAAAATLEQLLPRCRLVVSFSSSASITALLNGTPAISEDGAANAITGPLRSEAIRYPQRPDGRLHFAQVLADYQFTLDEFRDGTAWRWLDRSTPKE